MTDPLSKITEQGDVLGKIRGFLSGFVGYLDRETRREADRLLRDTVAQRFEEQWSRISEVQRQDVAGPHDWGEPGGSQGAAAEEPELTGSQNE